MKKSELTKKIMDRLLSLEKRRLIYWVVMVLVLLLLAITLEWRLINFLAEDLSEKGTLDLFTILSEDREILIDYGKDTWDIFKYEVSWVKLHRAILGSVIFLILLACILTRAKKKERRWKQIKEYENDKK